MENRILQNKIKCDTCRVEIESFHRHDFKFCDCGTVAVDGGHDYPRRIGQGWEDLSIYDDEDHQTRRNSLKWGVNYNKEGKLLPKTEWKLIKNMEDSHIKKILELYPGLDSFYKKIFKDELSFRDNEK